MTKNEQKETRQSGIDRRDFLIRSAIAGAALSFSSMASATSSRQITEGGQQARSDMKTRIFFWCRGARGQCAAAGQAGTDRERGCACVVHSEAAFLRSCKSLRLIPNC
jgi:hypothetical protein